MKPNRFVFSRWEVWEAYVKVKSNQGAAGLDGQSIEDFERDLKKNLYRIWNRMTSGSSIPPPVRTVKIPKANGGYRPNKSALDAVGQARQMCWAYDWVCDLEIKGFFDNLDHGLM